MEGSVRARCCGLDSVKQIKQAEAVQKGSTRAWQETTPKSIQRERWVMRRGINVKEQSRKKNCDAEEISQGKVYGEDGAGRAAGAVLLSAYVSSAQLFTHFLLDSMSSAQPSCAQTLLWMLQCTPQWWKEEPWEIFNATSLTSFIFWYVRAYRHHAALTNAVSLRIMLTM